jgi:hypothetical protein
MRDVREWEESDLDLVVAADQRETTTLDYKDSAALDFKNQTQLTKGRGKLGEKHRKDLVRDVASMANAEGGTIIYGIAERSGGYPDRIDDGVDPATVSAEQIEQIIHSNINPRVEGFFIRRIDLPSKRLGTCAFVISIPKAQKNAPHQADDKLYYRRHDTTTLTMGDNEIRDVIGRSLEFGRKFGIAWDMLVEVRRIVEAVRARLGIAEGIQTARRTLVVGVSPSLRSSGVAVMALPRVLRSKAAALVGDLDQYNSLIETSDPGQRDNTRLNRPMRELLGMVEKNGMEITDGLREVLKDQP